MNHSVPATVKLEKDKASSKHVPVSVSVSVSNYSIAGTKTPTQQVAGKKDDEDHFDNDERFVTSYVVVPPDGGWGWVVVGASLICNMLTEGLGLNFTYVYLDSLSGEFQAPITEVVLVVAIMRSSNLICGPFASALINRYGFRKIAISGGLISCISIGVCYFATSMTYLCIFYGVGAGVGNGMTFMASTLCLSFYFQRWRRLSVCLASCGINVGGAIMGPVLIYIRDLYGWRVTMLVTSGILFLCSCICILFRPIKPVRITTELERNLDTVSITSSPTPRRSSRPLGLVNRDFPTASRFVKRVGSETSFISRISMKTLAMDAQHSAAASTMLDALEPINWRAKQAGSDVSVRFVLGQDGVVEYWKTPLREKCELLKKVFCCKGKETEIGSRPLYRDDIFFEGHLADRHIGSLHLNLALTRMTTRKDIEEEKSSRCLCCPVAVRRALSTMLDVSLFKSPSFILLLLNSFLVYFTSITPFVYMPKRGTDRGMDPEIVDMVVPVLSISGLVGKLITAAITMIFPRLNLVIYVNGLSVLCGVAIIVIGCTVDVASQMAAASVYSITQSSYSSIRSLLVVELMGLERLTNAFGLMQLISGFASLFGPPFLGWIMELTLSFDAVFWVAGSIYIVAAVTLFPVSCINTWEKKTNS